MRILGVIVRGRGTLLQPPGCVSLRSTPPVQVSLREKGLITTLQVLDVEIVLQEWEARLHV